MPFHVHLVHAVVNQALPGTFLIAAAVAGMKHNVVGWFLGFSAAGTFKFTDKNGDLMGPINVIKDAPPVVNPPTYGTEHIFETVENSPLNLVTTGGAATGFVMYYDGK